MSVNELIKFFSRYLNVNIKFLKEDLKLSNCEINNWIQGNWETLVENNQLICCPIKVFGNGGSIHTSGRIIFPDEVPVKKINIKPTNNTKGYSFVSLTDCNGKFESLIDSVLVKDKNGQSKILSLEKTVFILEDMS